MRPRRQALDALRDSIAEPWQRTAGELLHDPWLARDDYIDVVLDRTDSSVAAFFERHAKGMLDRERRIRYHGAMDDSRDPDGVREHWLRDALDAVLDGREPATAETPAVGCTIKWRR